jgi:hypothetical protein
MTLTQNDLKAYVNNHPNAFYALKTIPTRFQLVTEDVFKKNPFVITYVQDPTAPAQTLKKGKVIGQDWEEKDILMPCDLSLPKGIKIEGVTMLKETDIGQKVISSNILPIDTLNGQISNSWVQGLSGLTAAYGDTVKTQVALGQPVYAIKRLAVKALEVTQEMIGLMPEHANTDKSGLSLTTKEDNTVEVMLGSYLTLAEGIQKAQFDSTYHKVSQDELSPTDNKGNRFSQETADALATVTESILNQPVGTQTKKQLIEQVIGNEVLSFAAIIAQKLRENVSASATAALQLSLKTKVDAIQAATTREEIKEQLNDMVKGVLPEQTKNLIRELQKDFFPTPGQQNFKAAVSGLREGDNPKTSSAPHRP